jgi:hypothetical protein
MLDNEVDNFIQTSNNYQGILLEYCFLTSLPQLSEEQADYLDDILEKAESDEFLNFLLIEFDHIIAKKLNLLDDQYIPYYQNQQAYLREYLIQLTTEEIAYHCEFQKLLRDEGYYRGPVDGVFGEDSREAVKQFQQSTHLQVNGMLTLETVLKLVPNTDIALKLIRPRSPDKED